MTRLVDLFTHGRANNMVAASFSHANSLENDAVMVTRSACFKKFRAALGVQSRQHRGRRRRVFKDQLRARLNARASRRQASVWDDPTFVEKGGAFIRFCSLASDFLRLLGKRLNRFSATTKELRTFTILVRARRASLTISPFRHLRSFGQLLSVVRAYDDRVGVSSLKEAGFRLTPFAVPVMAPCVVIYLRVAR